MFREYGFVFLLLGQSEPHTQRLLKACRKALRAEDRVLIGHCYTTAKSRRSDQILLTPSEFEARDEYGCYGLRWQAGGVDFAAGVEVDRWLDGGLNVILRVDAGALPAARAHYGSQLRLVCAPAPRQTGRWLTDLRQWGTKRPQISLGLAMDEELIEDHADAALMLDSNIAIAVEQLGFALRQATPPLAGEFERHPPPQPGNLLTSH